MALELWNINPESETLQSGTLLPVAGQSAADLCQQIKEEAPLQKNFFHLEGRLHSNCFYGTAYFVREGQFSHAVRFYRRSCLLQPVDWEAVTSRCCLRDHRYYFDHTLTNDLLKNYHNALLENCKRRHREAFVRKFETEPFAGGPFAEKSKCHGQIEIDKSKMFEVSDVEFSAVEILAIEALVHPGLIKALHHRGDPYQEGDLYTAVFKTEKQNENRYRLLTVKSGYVNYEFEDDSISRAHWYWMDLDL
jgi:hypothetical protein